MVKVRGVKHTNNITHGLSNVFDLNSTEQIVQFVSRGRADVALTNTIDGLIGLKSLGMTDVIATNQPLAKIIEDAEAAMITDIKAN